MIEAIVGFFRRPMTFFAQHAFQQLMLKRPGGAQWSAPRFVRSRIAPLLLAAGAIVEPVQAVPFLEQNLTEIRCYNVDATLVIDRATWCMRLLDENKHVQFSEATAPAFNTEAGWTALAKIISAESDGPASVRLEVELVNGRRAKVTVGASGPNGFRVIARLIGAPATGIRGAIALGNVEEIYGFGEMWNGHVAQRGQSFDLWDKGGTPDECAYMPYYVSTNNYALFLNYGGRVHFDVGQRRSDWLTYEAPTAELDLMLVRGTSIPSAVRHFLTEIGMPQRPPRWSFKPWFWLMADPSQPGAKIDTLKGEHFVEMVKKLHELSIPIGVTWFEPPWQDGRTTFKPNPEFSRDMPGLVRQLRELGVRTLAWTVPYTTNTASNWKEAVEHGYLAAKPGAKTGESGVKISASGELIGSYYNSIDFYNPEAVQWWQHQIEGSFSTGMQGFKLDAGQDLEPDAELFGNRIGRDVHNAYALEYNRVFFDVLKKRFGDDFLMIPRAAWVGSSAYTNFKWPGDLSGSFANNGLPSSVYSTLSLAFCGIPFVSTDIGGFENQPAPEEPWLRWAQFGAMLPGMQTLHMPWWYSAEAQKHFRYLTWLHTDLTPFWMSLAHEAAVTGAPLCRPLVWTFQDDIDSWRVDDEFTVGEALLVAPMLNNNPERSVYLPAGVWHDFWNDSETIRGPVRTNWFKGWTARDKFPLYIREGAIIPLEVSNEVSGFGWPESADYVTLAIWPKASGLSEFTLHDTEGPVKIGAERLGNRLRINWGVTQRNHLFRIHLTDRPASVSSDTGPMREFDTVDTFRHEADGWVFDETSHKLWIRKTNHGSVGSLSIMLTAPSKSRVKY